MKATPYAPPAKCSGADFGERRSVTVLLFGHTADHRHNSRPKRLRKVWPSLNHRFQLGILRQGVPCNCPRFCPPRTIRILLFSRGIVANRIGLEIRCRATALLLTIPLNILAICVILRRIVGSVLSARLPWQVTRKHAAYDSIELNRRWTPLWGLDRGGWPRSVRYACGLVRGERRFRCCGQAEFGCGNVAERLRIANVS